MTSHSRKPSDALDNARVICGFLASAVDGLPMPGLKAVAQTCTSILDIALTLKANEEDALIVAERACELAKAIVDGTRMTECNSQVEDNLNVEKFVLVLKDVENVMVSLSRQKFFQCLRKLRGNQQAIADCKEKIDHAFKGLLVTVSLGLRRAIVMSQLSALNVVDEDAENPDVPVIPFERIDLSGYKEGTNSIQEGILEPETKRVIVKLYWDQKIWRRDLMALKRQRNAFLLQLIGRSSKKSNPLYTVLRDPGIPMQRYVMQQCVGTPRDASLNLITTIKGMVGGAQYLTEKGRCLFDTAAVYVRPSGNAVLADFGHGDSHSEIAPTTDHTWNTFMRLSAKVITGGEGRSNYVLGQHGTTGQRATRLMRFYLHFLFDFRFYFSLQHFKIQPGRSNDNSANTLFDNLFLTLSEVRDDVEASPLDSDNPLRESLQQRFSSGLCGFWDVWESLGVAPGDIGVMDKGRDPKRPQFRKFTNVAQEFADVNAVKRDVVYWPETLWSRDTLADGMIRHTLRLKDADISTTFFGFLEGEDFANLDSKWDKTTSWKWLEENRSTFEVLAETHGVAIHDICLIFSCSKNPKLTRIRTKLGTLSQRNAVLVDAGFPDGILYYFENLSAEEGDVHGYWSGSPEPGKPVWPPVLDAPGPVWAWCHGDDHFEEVTVSRKGPVEHIRYLGY